MTPPKSKRVKSGSAAVVSSRTLAESISAVHPNIKKQAVDDTSKLHRNLNDLDASIQELKNELQLLQTHLHDCMVDDDEEENNTEGKTAWPSGTSPYQRRVFSQNNQVHDMVVLVKGIRGSLTV